MDSSNLSEAEVILGQRQRRVQQCSWGQANTTGADAEDAEDYEAERLFDTGTDKKQEGLQQQARHHQQWLLRRQSRQGSSPAVAGVVTMDQWLPSSQVDIVGKRVHWEGAAAHCYAAEATACSTASRVAAEEERPAEVQ